jgi:hypothetical protein
VALSLKPVEEIGELALEDGHKAINLRLQFVMDLIVKMQKWQAAVKNSKQE